MTCDHILKILQLQLLIRKFYCEQKTYPYQSWFVGCSSTPYHQANFTHCTVLALLALFRNVYVNVNVLVSGAAVETCSEFRVVVSRHIVMETTELIQAIAGMFAAHYVFNKSYRPQAVATLDYIQR